jgi:hypothetical protein
MSSIQSLSAKQLHQAANLKEKIEALTKELSQLAGSTDKTIAAAKEAKGLKKRRGMSAAGRARIAAGQKARWAKIKSGKLTIRASSIKVVSTARPTKKKFRMSASAKAKISVAAKARWAKIKAAKK